MSIKITNELLEKYANGKCTPEERMHIELWYNQYAESKQSKIPDLSQIDKANQEIWSKVALQIKPLPIVNFRFLKVAAAFFVIATISLIIYQINYNVGRNSEFARPNFAAGKLGAVVSIASSEAQVSNANDFNKMISELESKQEIKISTAIGEEYHATLPDGSEIWLNANSEVSIPANFNETYRDLNLKKGEAYFKVAKNRAKPFRVFADKTKIEALGTEFNVNFYGENKGVKAFLVEGSISVSKKDEQAVIKPNQLYQANHLTGAASVIEIENPATQYAWKSGYFEYANTPISEILEELSRWYNFSFEIHPTYKNKTLTGKISRKQPFNEVLAILEFSGIKYRKEESNLVLEP